MSTVTIKDLRAASIAKLWFRRAIRAAILSAFPEVKLPKLYLENCEVDTEKGIAIVHFLPIPEEIFDGLQHKS